MVGNRRIGITGMMPIELIFDSGAVPLDIRNFFIQHPDRVTYIQRGEMDGIPDNAGIMTKGIYGTVMENKIEEVVVVFQKDSIKSYALAEMFESQGVIVSRFNFPEHRNRQSLKLEIENLAKQLKMVNLENLEYWRFKLNEIRELARRIDELTYEKNIVSGYENHKYLASMTDFEGDTELYMTKLYNFLDEIKNEKPFKQEIRLGFIGEPPIFPEIYKIIERCGARVVFNEVQRQYAMPYPADSVIDQYLKYTFPYDISKRVEDINAEIERRNIHGIIHYIDITGQAFADEMLFRREIGLPILTVEGGNSLVVNVKTITQISNFVNMLKEKMTYQK
ncbi:2-hydroxyacyl-CoA dehydratase [bacterium]|nr:MAG: 2-hydroxyacyl-CoA dehydratase [bacterium]